MKKILIVGGSGYIGSVLIKSCIENKLFVYNLDNKIYQDQINLNSKKNSYVKNLFIDFREKEKILKVLEEVDKVIILAGLVGDYITKKYKDLSKSINENGLKNLINLIGSKQNIKKLVFISTCSNYGLSETNKFLDENSQLNPLSLYAKAKVNIEKYIISQTGNFNFDFTILRFATAFGLSERMRYDLTINHFCASMYYDKKLEIYDSDTWRPYCHVKDFSRIILEIFSDKNFDKVKNQIFNVGSDKNNFKKYDIAKLINQYLPDAEIIKKKLSGSDKRNYKVSFRKLKEVLNIEPEIDVETGVKEILDDLKKIKNKNLNIKELLNKGNFEILKHANK